MQMVAKGSAAVGLTGALQQAAAQLEPYREQAADAMWPHVQPAVDAAAPYAQQVPSCLMLHIRTFACSPTAQWTVQKLQMHHSRGDLGLE